MTTMICNTCGKKAAIRMRQHRLALCKAHYITWVINQTQRFIVKYELFGKSERILVAVSGGKDSLALWDVLWRLGYTAEGLYIHLGILGESAYSDLSQTAAQNFADERGLKLHLENIHEGTGRTVPEWAKVSPRGRGKPCAVCGLIKRHSMNRTAHELGFNVLATGHNLDDEAAFLYGNILSWNIRQIRRQSPSLPEKEGFTRKVKPFFLFTERETAAYAVLQGIEYVEDECPFSEGSKQIEYKHMLNQLEESQPGVKIRFLLGFMQVRDDGYFPLDDVSEKGLDLQPCSSCGQITSTGGLCAYCRMIENSTKR